MMTTYEKHEVQPGAEVLVKGTVTYNCINKKRKPQATELNANPAPEFAIAVDDPQYKGDKNLIAALKEKQYGDDKNKLSLRSTSPFAPMIFGVDKQGKAADEIIPEDEMLKNGQPVVIHVRTFKTKLNLGCAFDAVELTTPLNQIELEKVGSAVTADVFSNNFDDNNQVSTWE